MPLVPNNGKLFFELDSPKSVADLIETAARIDPAKAGTFFSAEHRIVADIGDHLLYLSATSPEWFAPYREQAVGELYDRLPMALDVAAILLAGTSDTALESILARLRTTPTSWSDLTMLAGIGSEQALTALALHIRQNPDTEQWTNRLGVHVPSSGPAVRRFTNERFAITSADSLDHGVLGLELDQITDDQAITWHYLSFRPSLVPGLPGWPHDLLHIVSPRTYWFTLHAVASDGGRYVDVDVTVDEELFDAHLAECEADPPPPLGLHLRRYDADLTYRNGHISSTRGVYGTAGGPPIGIYPNPVCPDCGVLMFHGASIESSAREYGEGFRSVYYCESCVRTATTGTNWN